MKTYVLIISEHFPKTHKRAGEDTNFPLAIKHYDKIHTIRANYDLWKKRFQEIDNGNAVLSIRIWMGKPYRSKQAEIFRYDKIRGIGIEKLEFLNLDGIPKFSYPLINRLPYPYIEHIAANDGLDFDDFKVWFSSYDLSKPMAIIHFTEFRYNLKTI